MTYDTYRIIFLAAAVLAGVFLIASVIIFILLKIPSVIGDLSGATARKAINEIRNGNEKTGTKTHKESNVNKARGKITDKISQSGSIEVNKASGFAMGTAKISTAQLNTQVKASSVAGDSNETTVLEQQNETAVLGQTSETTVLGQSEVSAKKERKNETKVLPRKSRTTSHGQSVPPENAAHNGAVEATQPLGIPNDFNKTVTLAKAFSETGNTSELGNADAAKTVEHTFKILYDITLINTREIIC